MSEFHGLKFLSERKMTIIDLEQVPDSEFICVVRIPFPFPEGFYFDLE